MRFGVLGPVTAWAADGSPVRVPEVKVRALLADLLVHEGRPVPADRLADDLWGDNPPGNPANTLQTKVSQLRRALGDRDLVAYQPTGYLLRTESVDALQFAELLARAAATADPAVKAAVLSEALALWRGPAYADFREETFARAAAARLDEQRLTALEELAEVRLALGEHRRLADELGEQVAEHPLRERLRAVHLRSLYLAGRQSEALAGYAELRHLLAEDLGLDPGPELAALHQAMLEQDPALAPAPPPVTSAARPRTNLPAPLTGLVGREAAVAALSDLIAEARLVTLTGPGGVGKTRLALAVAERLADDAFPDGVWLVELAGATGGVAELVAAELGVRDEAATGLPHPDLAHRLADALRARRLLLVLDNCEHLVEQVAELVGLLLRTSPGLRVLATSQESLAIPGERLHAVAPLEQASAVELFAARAAAAAPGFALDEESAPWVAAICARLDGLPLALELAAARVRALGARGVAERLDDRFQLLSAEIRGLPPRQRTLRAVIDWSREQLTGAQRAGMFALAVQPGGCTLEAAEAVGAGLDVLDQLVNRSMVVVDTPPRYRLLESVAAYCLDRLDPADPVFVRRDAYYTELAERAAPHLYGHAQGHWLRRLDEESPNLRAVLDSGADPSRPACALAWYWYLRGKHSEGHRYLAGSAAWGAGFAMLTGVGGATPVQPPDARSRWFLAHAHLHLGDAAAAEELIEAALADFRASGDRWGEAAALAGRAKKAIFQGELKAAERDGEESLALFGELGDRWGRLQALDQLGYLAELGGVPPPGSSAIRAPSPWPPRGWPERLPPPRRRAACWRRRARSGSRSALPSRPPSAGTWRGSPPGSRARRGTTQGCFRVVPDGTPPRFVGELAIVKTKQTMVMAGLIGLGVTLTGCGLVGATDRETAAYDVTDKVTGLRVEADSGTVEVVESDRTGIHVTETLIWEKSKPTTSHVVKGDTLMLTFTCPISVGFNSGCDVSYLVEVPKGLRVDVESDSGQVTLTNLSGEVKVTSDSGGIEADRLTAKRVRTETDSGGTKLVFTTPPDRVETKSDSGATEVRVPKGPYHVTAETQSGGKEIDAVHDDSAPRTIEMSSDSGRLEIVAS